MQHHQRTPKDNYFYIHVIFEVEGNGKCDSVIEFSTLTVSDLPVNMSNSDAHPIGWKTY